MHDVARCRRHRYQHAERIACRTRRPGRSERNRISAVAEVLDLGKAFRPVAGVRWWSAGGQGLEGRGDAVRKSLAMERGGTRGE